MHPLTKQKLEASAIVFVIVVIIGLYTSIRHQAFDLYIFNKIAAGASGVLLGIVLITGVFGRLYAFFDKMLMYRKWLGMAAFKLAYAHGIITLFLLPDKFPASRFHLGNTAFVFALISLFVLSVLFVYSFQFAIDSMNRHTWWKLQNWGVRIAFIAGLLHAVLVKLPYWQRWIAGNETGIGNILPPAGLLITIGLMYVIGVRLSEFLGKEKATKAISVLNGVTLLVICGIGILGIMRV